MFHNTSSFWRCIGGAGSAGACGGGVVPGLRVLGTPGTHIAQGCRRCGPRMLIVKPCLVPGVKPGSLFPAPLAWPLCVPSSLRGSGQTPLPLLGLCDALTESSARAFVSLKPYNLDPRPQDPHSSAGSWDPSGPPIQEVTGKGRLATAHLWGVSSRPRLGSHPFHLTQLAAEFRPWPRAPANV